MRVGVFDSGVGGLTVLSKLVSKYPKNDYIYFGDTINIPYGEKDIDTLFNLSSKIIEYLISKKVDLIVIACGTVSSNCYEKLKSTYNIPIIDIISPTINYVKENNYKSIGVFATSRTINSHIFKNLLPNVLVEELACPSFVDLIESGNIEKIDTSNYVSKIKSDTIILGCTHYPLIKDKINKKTIDMADNIKLDKNEGNSSIELYFSKLDNKVLNNIKLFNFKDNIIIKEKNLSN